jgi:hypothetical protein
MVGWRCFGKGDKTHQVIIAKRLDDQQWEEAEEEDSE